MFEPWGHFRFTRSKTALFSTSIGVPNRVRALSPRLKFYSDCLIANGILFARLTTRLLSWTKLSRPATALIITRVNIFFCTGFILLLVCLMYFERVCSSFVRFGVVLNFDGEL